MPLTALHAPQSVFTQLLGAVRACDPTPSCKWNYEGGGVVVATHFFGEGEDTLSGMLGRNYTAREVRYLLVRHNRGYAVRDKSDM